MRSLEKWEKKIKWKYISRLTPRIQNDLKILKPPKIKLPISSCYIYGNTEYGKTIYSVFLMLEQLKSWYLNSEFKTCCFKSVEDLFKEIKSTFNSETSNEEDLIAFYCNLDLLVLDDIGVRSSDWIVSVLYLIINFRYENNKQTIITSNLDLDGLSKFLNDTRIPSRIERMCKIIEKQNWKK